MPVENQTTPREMRRRQSFRDLAKAVLNCVLAHDVSRSMSGYWQRRNKRNQEFVGWSPLEGMGVLAAA